MAKRFWLLKTEPASFSITTLAACPGQTTCWDGVRNYQARNRLRDDVAVGDGVLLYHSRHKPLAVVGTAIVTRAGYPDASQFDPRDDHFDPSASRSAPRWFGIDIRLEQIFPRPVMRQVLHRRQDMGDLELLRAGCRLSVQTVSAAQYWAICGLGSADTKVP